MSLARCLGVVGVVYLFSIVSVNGLLKAPRSKFVGKVLSCLKCPHDEDFVHHAKRFAKSHTHEYDGLHLEEVHEEDIHELVIHHRISGEEVSRHDISGLEHHDIRKLALQNGLRLNPSEKHIKRAKRARAEIQHCSTCDRETVTHGGQPPRKLAQTYQRVYRYLEVAEVENKVRNTHDLVVFDATGRETDRKDLSTITPQEAHALLLRRGLKLHRGESHHIAATITGADGVTRVMGRPRVGGGPGMERHRKLYADHLESHQRRRLAQDQAQGRRLNVVEVGVDEGGRVSTHSGAYDRSMVGGKDNRAKAAAAGHNGKPNVCSTSRNGKFKTEKGSGSMARRHEWMGRYLNRMHY